jgi:hypothetical protein
MSKSLNRKVTTGWDYVLRGCQVHIKGEAQKYLNLYIENSNTLWMLSLLLKGELNGELRRV